METFLKLDLLNKLTIIQSPYIYAIITYLLSSLLIVLYKNQIYKKTIIISTPLISSLLLFNNDLFMINLNSRFFNLSDLFIQILLVVNLCLSVNTIKKDSKYPCLIFILVAASIASISTINLIQCFFFYVFISYIPFFTLIDISGNFNKYRSFLITSMLIDMSLLAGISFFTGESSFLIGDNIRFYIIIPLLFKSSVFPLHFLLQSLITKIDYDIFIVYSINLLLITVYILIQKFSGTKILIYAGYITAIYSILFSIVHNDIRYIVNFILISSTAILIFLAGLFSDVYELYQYVISVYLGCLILLITISDIIKNENKYYLNECEGLFFRMPWHFLSILSATIILIGIPFFSHFGVLQIIVFKVAKISFWYKLSIYLYLSLLIISVIRIIYYFFKKEQSETVHKQLNLSIFITILLYIIMKVLYFHFYNFSFEIFSDYLQVLVVSIVAFAFLKDTIKSERGFYISFDFILNILGRANNLIVKPMYLKGEYIFDLVLNTKLQFNFHFLRYFDFFEIKISDSLQIINTRMKQFSIEINSINSFKIRLFTAFTIILLSVLIILVVILNGK